jgi:hypothetical protein
MEILRSRPLWQNHPDNQVTGLRMFGDRRQRAARTVDTVRNSGGVK